MKLSNIYTHTKLIFSLSMDLLPTAYVVRCKILFSQMSVCPHPGGVTLAKMGTPPAKVDTPSQGTPGQGRYPTWPR